MRILLINHEFPPTGGGGATACARIAEHMTAAGYSVTVLTSAFAGQSSHERRDGVEIVRIPALRRFAHKSSPWEMTTFLLSSLFWVLARGRKKRFGVCIAFFGLPAGLTALLLKRLTGIPYIVSLRGGDVPGHSPYALKNWHRLTGWLIRRIWRLAFVTVANSSGLARLAEKFSSEISISVIANGVDTAPFVRPRFKYDDNSAVRLITTGRLEAGKNIAFLLQSLADISNTPWMLTIVGDGPERRNLETMVERLGLADRVLFTGWMPRERMPECLAKADIYVFPSWQEGMPNTVLEAMAAGLPVVAHPVEGVEELVLHGKTGFLVSVGDAKAFAASIGTLVDNKELRMRFGEAGRERVVKEYSWQKAAEAYGVLCQKAIAQGDGHER